MRPFRDLPIRHKLTGFIMLVSGLALLMVILAVLGYELFTFRQRSVTNLAALADMIKVNAEPTLDFDDDKTAQEILNVLKSEPEIVAACIYAKDGTVFARYVRPEESNISFPPPQPDGHAFQGRDLILFRGIRSEGVNLGTIYLRYDQTAAYARVPHYTVILAVVVLAMLLLSLILSTVLQRIISAPLLHLTRAVRLITERKDYSVRAVKESEDEIGQLADTFNQMLAAIAARENALNQARDELEQRGVALERELAERKRVEAALELSQAELKNYAGELEARVRERTGSLQESLQALEGVLYHVAHDLRAPLRAMQGFTTMLLQQYGPNLDADGKEYASKISAAAIRMDRLIQDLLEYGRLGHVEVVCKGVDLESAIPAVLHLVDEQIKNKRAEIEIEHPLPIVRANPKMLEQVLVNLLDNALKFVAPGVAPRIQIRAEKKESKVRVWFQDNGIGIDPEYQERIFKVFERLHSSEGYPGTGIGLAIVRKGMERMGGAAGVESGPGQGSRFWLDFPPASNAT